MTAAGEAAGDGNVAALERSDNVAGRGHAFAGLKRGYPRMGGYQAQNETRPGALQTNCRSGFMPRFRQTIAA